MRIFAFYLLLLICNSVCNEQPPVVFVNNNFPTSSDCSVYFGKKLMQCMECQDAASLKNTFLQFNERKASYYFTKLDLAKQKEFITHFNDQEWGEWYSKLTDEHKKHFPEDRTAFLKSGPSYSGTIIFGTLWLLRMFLKPGILL